MKTLHIASLGDVHLGHARNNAVYIAENLKKAFPDDAGTAELDIIFIVGDFYDQLLINNGDDVYVVDNIILYFLRLCKKYDIVLRVLHGTNSHDFSQPRRFVHLNTGAMIGCDLKYFDVMSIEYIEKHSITVLYIPDEWNEDTNVTLVEARELLRLNGLEKVDYAIMHGNFPHQLPAVARSPTHDPQAYLSLVDKLIFIGHVHHFSKFDRIIAQGSFDRLVHGEEQAKGHVRAHVKSADDYEITFVENTNARIFKTIKCTSMTIAETLEEISNLTKDIPDESFVRIECSSDNPIVHEMDQLSRMRPFITWSKLVRDSGEQINNEIILEEDIYVPITITRDNISRLVMDRLMNQNVHPDVLELAEKALNEHR